MRRILLVAVVASLVACSKHEEHPPSLGSFELSPAALPQDRVLSGSLAFADADGDLAAVESVLTERRSGAVSGGRDELPDLRGARSGMLSFTLEVASLPPGDYALEMTLVDGGGRRSEPRTAGFELWGGFSAGVRSPLPTPYVFLGKTAIADLDGDGRLDVVAREQSNATRRVFTWHQTATGALATPADELDTGLAISGMAAGDVNGDGRADLVVSGAPISGAGGAVVRVWLQAADGTRSDPVSVPVASAGGLAIADVDGDGRSDVVLAGWFAGGVAGGVAILYQDASGTLDAPVVIAADLHALGGEVHLADLDGNGFPDVVVQSGQRELAVLRQTSSRTFAAPDRYDTLTSYWSEAQAFAVGDLNGDGRADLVATDPGNGSYLNVYWQTDHGTLAGPVPMRPGFDMPAGVEIGDVDGDGLDDLAFDSGGGIVTVLHQLRGGGFSEPFTYSVPTQSGGGTMVREALSIGDVTGDGRPDLVVSWSDEGVFVVPHL